jgi:hypothetical protein
MGFRRVFSFIVLLAALAAIYGAYAPDVVEKWSPSAGIYAWRLHDALPPSLASQKAGRPS